MAWAPGLAAVHAELGQVDDARDGLESLVSTTGVRLARDGRHSLSLSFLADAAAFLGDGERAEVLYRDLLPYAGLCIATYCTTCYGPAFRYLGMLATAMGRFDDAEDHFRDALAGCDRLESPLWRAHTQYQLTRMLLTRRRTGDVAAAERLCRGAQETAAGFGMRALEERAGRLLESGLDAVPRR
jgi:tetratricopeptide (TPR) repeat protein